MAESRWRLEDFSRAVRRVSRSVRKDSSCGGGQWCGEAWGGEMVDLEEELRVGFEVVACAVAALFEVGRTGGAGAVGGVEHGCGVRGESDAGRQWTTTAG